MSEQQRADLYFLATGHPPTTPGKLLAVADGDDIDLVMRADPSPAILTDHLGTVLAGNDAVKGWFPGLVDTTGSGSNAVLWFFSGGAGEHVANIDEVRALCVGRLKSILLRYPADNGVTALVERLLRVPEAARLWTTEYATTARSTARIRVRHPDLDGICELAGATVEFANGNRLHIGYLPAGPR